MIGGVFGRKSPLVSGGDNYKLQIVSLPCNDLKNFVANRLGQMIVAIAFVEKESQDFMDAFQESTDAASEATESACSWIAKRGHQ